MKIALTTLYMIIGVHVAVGYAELGRENCVPHIDFSSIGAAIAWPVVVPLMIHFKMTNYCPAAPNKETVK